MTAINPQDLTTDQLEYQKLVLLLQILRPAQAAAGISVAFVQARDAGSRDAHSAHKQAPKTDVQGLSIQEILNAWASIPANPHRSSCVLCGKAAIVPQAGAKND